MGFLTYWRDRQPEEEQGNLLQPEQKGDPVVNRSEPTRLNTYHRLHGEVKKRGGTGRTQAVINAIQNDEILGEDHLALYEALALDAGQREKLPQEAKEALMVGDIAAFHQIMLDNAEGHSELVDSSRKGLRRARKLFPW